jgi:hypothetical protein
MDVVAGRGSGRLGMTVLYAVVAWLAADLSFEVGDISPTGC